MVWSRRNENINDTTEVYSEQRNNVSPARLSVTFETRWLLAQNGVVVRFGEILFSWERDIFSSPLKDIYVFQQRVGPYLEKLVLEVFWFPSCDVPFLLRNQPKDLNEQSFRLCGKREYLTISCQVSSPSHTPFYFRRVGNNSHSKKLWRNDLKR